MLKEKLPPQLPEEEQNELAKRWIENKDLVARNKLASHSLGLIAKCVYQMNPSGLHVEDMFQVGVFGLLRAIDNYNPAKSRFSYWCFKWIKAYCQSYRRDREHFFRQAQRQPERQVFSSPIFWKYIGQDNGTNEEQLSYENIAILINKSAEANGTYKNVRNVTEEDVRRVHLQVYLNRQVVSLDLSLFVDQDDSPTYKDNVIDTEPLADERYEQEETDRVERQLFIRAFQTLDSREKYVISHYTLKKEYGEGESGHHKGGKHTEHKVSLKIIGKKFGISRERVRQIQNEAIAKMKAFVKEQGS